MKILEEAGKRTSRWNQLNQNPANRAEHLSGAIRRCSKSPLFGNYGVIVSITPFSRVPVSTAKKPTYQERSSVAKCIGDDALVDARGIAGGRARMGLSCAIIFEQQSVQMPGAEGEAARRDRLLPTGRR